MKILKSKKGFTMLELLMVVIVIGILASLAIPQYQSFMEKARVAEAKQMIGAIKNAQELYYLEHNRYGTEGEIRGNYITYPTSGNDTFWTYHIITTWNIGYVIGVNRTSKDGTAKSYVGYFVFDRPNTEQWLGVLA